MGEMRFERTDGGKALICDQRGLLGWVLTACNGKFTYNVAFTQTERKLFNTEEEAEGALKKELENAPVVDNPQIKLWDGDRQGGAIETYKRLYGGSKYTPAEFRNLYEGNWKVNSE